MKLLFLAPLWGSEHLPFETFLDKACATGFDGVEINLPMQHVSPDKAHKMCEQVEARGLALGLQNVNTIDADFATHEKALIERARFLTEFKPLFINSHTGRDFFSIEQNLALIDALAELDQQTGVPIYNETHRQRFNFAAHVCAEFVTARPTIKQTADFSHFCCVAGSLLADQKIALDSILPTIEHIHARVGHSESPQVSAPEAPEYAEALDAHLHWWLTILARAREQKRPYFTITCEFGPAPYMPTLPYTQQPISDQWALNQWMKDTLKHHYALTLQSATQS